MAASPGLNLPQPPAFLKARAEGRKLPVDIGAEFRDMNEISGFRIVSQ